MKKEKDYDVARYSMPQAAKQLCISPDTLLGECDANRISYSIIGRRKKFSSSDIYSYVSRQHVEIKVPVVGEEDGPITLIPGIKRISMT